MDERRDCLNQQFSSSLVFFAAIKTRGTLTSITLNKVTIDHVNVMQSRRRKCKHFLAELINTSVRDRRLLKIMLSADRGHFQF